MAVYLILKVPAPKFSIVSQTNRRYPRVQSDGILGFSRESFERATPFVLLKFESRKSFNKVFIKSHSATTKETQFRLRSDAISEIVHSKSFNKIYDSATFGLEDSFVLKTGQFYFDDNECETEFLICEEKVTILEHCFFQNVRANAPFYTKAIKLFLLYFPPKEEDVFDTDSDDSAKLLYQVKQV